MTFSILSINVSERTGVQKKPVVRAVLRQGHGIVGDAHAGDWHRQVSLLAQEDIDTLRGRGIEIGFGDFAENITTLGVALGTLRVGAHLSLGVPAGNHPDREGVPPGMRDLPHRGGLRHAAPGSVRPRDPRRRDRP